MTQKTSTSTPTSLALLYQIQDAWGILTSIDLYDCNPELIRSAEHIQAFVKELCDRLEVKRFGECQVVHFGENEKVSGYSMVQLIETSLISGHFANKTNAAYIDIFSCKFYEPQIAIDFTKQYFEAKDVTHHYILRKNPTVSRIAS